MGNDGIDHAHMVRFFGAVAAAEEEDLSSKLLAHLAREVRRSKAAVEARDVGVRLLEHRVLATREGEVAHHVQAVTAADREAGNHGDHDLWHEAHETLRLEDVQATRARGIDARRVVALSVAVAVSPTDPLVAAAAESPTAVLWRGTVPREEHAAHVGRHARVIERLAELVDRAGTECVADLRPVEGDADRPLVGGAVIRDVLEREARNGLPALGVEDVRDHAESSGLNARG